MAERLHARIGHRWSAFPQHDETFTVLEGRGEVVQRDGSRTAIEKGSVVLVPAKFYYDIKNTGDSVLALWAIAPKRSAVRRFSLIPISTKK